jgi:hypothetical protein
MRPSSRFTLSCWSVASSVTSNELNNCFDNWGLGGIHSKPEEIWLWRGSKRSVPPVDSRILTCPAIRANYCFPQIERPSQRVLPGYRPVIASRVFAQPSKLRDSRDTEKLQMAGAVPALEERSPIPFQRRTQGIVVELEILHPCRDKQWAATAFRYPRTQSPYPRNQWPRQLALPGLAIRENSAPSDLRRRRLAPGLYTQPQFLVTQEVEAQLPFARVATMSAIRSAHREIPEHRDEPSRSLC